MHAWRQRVSRGVRGIRCTWLMMGVATLLQLATSGVVAAQERVRADNVPAEPPPLAPGASPMLDSARALRGAPLQVAVYIYGPGDFVFEKFGHIALAITDPATGEDIAYNWGMFDFEQPNFLGRFLTGDTRYWMAGYPTSAFNAVYQAQNRSIRKLTLSLDATQRGALADYVAWNAREQNRYYRYDYYRDNCSTRVRDALDWVLGGSLRPALDRPGAGRTWRGETARITASDLPVFAGIHLALGRNADRPLTQWEEGFLPDYLGDYLVGARGSFEPLVTQDTVLFNAAREPMPTVAPTRAVGALALGLTLAFLLVALDRAPAPWGARVLSVVGSGVFILGGVLGTALMLAGTVTKHAPYMGNNMTVLQLHPLWLAAGALWPWRNADTRLGRAAAALTVLIATLATVGALLGLLPMFRQRSPVVLAVVLPVTQALAVIVWERHARLTRERAR
jgi:hypothetical protein